MTPFDLSIVGNDAAAYLLAAYAGACGAKTVLVLDETIPLKFQSALVAPIPNKIWRALDLQKTGIRAEPVSGTTTLLPDGDDFSVPGKLSPVQPAIADIDEQDARNYADFSLDMRECADRSKTHETDIAALMQSLSVQARSANDVLSDYFNCDIVKTHFAAASLMATAKGAEAPGSAALLLSYFSEDAGLMRLASNAGDWRKILAERCDALGVVTVNSKKSMALGGFSQKGRALTIEGEDIALVRAIVFSSPASAAIAGVVDCLEEADLYQSDLATAIVRYRLRKPVNDRLKDPNAVYQIIDRSYDLQAAEDAARLGRLFEDLPVTVEILPGGDILARSSYCPKKFFEDGELRDWSGQDRQAVTKLITNRLKSRIDGLDEMLERTQSHVDVVQSQDEKKDCRGLHVVPDVHHKIAEGVRILDSVLAP